VRLARVRRCTQGSHVGLCVHARGTHAHAQEVRGGAVARRVRDVGSYGAFAHASLGVGSYDAFAHVSLGAGYHSEIARGNRDVEA